jgi:hypothetical protein
MTARRIAVARVWVPPALDCPGPATPLARKRFATGMVSANIGQTNNIRPKGRAVAGNVIAFRTGAANGHRLRFTSAERKIVSVLGHVPGYEVSFESEDGLTERAVISGNGGNYTLVDLVRISLVPGGFKVVDGSAQPAILFESVEEAVITAWQAVWRRMAAYGLR